MALVLARPQFQVLTHAKTGAISGRIYFPALFLAEFSGATIQWLQRREISFDRKDLKIYGDGSFRIYFKSQLSPKIEYLTLISIIEKEC